MKIRYTHKLRPGEHATQALHEHASASRWVWNKCVELFNNKQPTGQKTLFQQLTQWRKEHPWLGELPVTPQQQTIRDFGEARKEYLRKTRGKPKFKKAHAKEVSLNYTQRGFTITPDQQLKIAGGTKIPVIWSRELPSQPTSVRVYKDSAGWYWASFVVDTPEHTKERTQNGLIGIDWGVSQPATTTNPEYDLQYSGRVEASAKKLAQEQRKMALHRKAQNWGAYQKAKYRAAVIHRKLGWQRKEQARAWAQNIAKNHAVIAVEDFKSAFLFKTRMVRKAADNSVGLLKSELLRAAEQYGSEVILVDPRHTTMDCSQCGSRAKARLDLSVRVFVCDSCGYSAGRDFNAARNMLIRAGFTPADIDTPTGMTVGVESGIPRL